MTIYWFRPKRYGYGATPVTWQGWAVTLAAALAVAATTAWLTTLTAVSPWFWVAVLIDIAVIVALWRVTRRKTDGELRWRWGNDRPAHWRG